MTTDDKGNTISTLTAYIKKTGDSNKQPMRPRNPGEFQTAL